MSLLRNSSIALLFFLLALQAFAQSAEPAQEGSTQTAAVANRTRVPHHGLPCWRQAGMTPDMVNQRWKIEDQQKVKIAEVCAEPTTSAQQKHDKIEEIYVDTDRAIAHLIPTKELTAFNKCEADVDQRRPKATGQKELGPCGGVIPNSASTDVASTPEHRHDAAANH